MRIRFTGIFLVLALAAALPITASAQLNQTGSLMGTVSDNQKQPLPGVAVTMASTRPAKASRVAASTAS